MLIYLSFQAIGNFSYITLQAKEEEPMLKHYSHWYECLLSGPCSSNSIFSCWHNRNNPGWGYFQPGQNVLEWAAVGIVRGFKTMKY